MEAQYITGSRYRIYSIILSSLEEKPIDPKELIIKECVKPFQQGRLYL